jgi:trehalose-6-phosphatase
VDRRYDPRTPGSFVEEKDYSLVWHYRLADPEFGAWLANELVSMLEAMLAEAKAEPYGMLAVPIAPLSNWLNRSSSTPA